MFVVYSKRFIGLLGLAGLLSVLIYWAVAAWSANDRVKERIVKPNKTLSLVAHGYRPLSLTVTSQPLIQAFMSQDPGRVQLVDFFSYGCYGCMRWYPILQRWATKHATKVVVYHFPLLFQKQLEPLAHAYYIAQTLKRSDLNLQIFRAIHEHHLPLTDQAQLADFFSTQGIAKKTFNDLYASFSLSQALTQAKNMAFAYQITLSPSVILNTPHGSYLITPDMIQGNGREEDLFKVLDGLLTAAPKEKKDV